MKLASINPSNYQVVGEVEISTQEEIIAKVALARKAQKAWHDLGISGKVALMRKVAQKIEEYRGKIVSLSAEEMGMPVTQVDEDVTFSIEYLNSYCDTAETHLASVVTLETETEIHEVFHEPYGVAACIAPWNFPLANWVWQCGQNLVSGNTVVFKHSEECPLMGKLIEEMINSVLPEGVFNEVYGGGEVGELLINQDVNLICFTGSTKTGALINEAAARRFIPTIMELGGSAPGIIFEDADIEEIKGTIYSTRFTNCGQMCDALKRLIVHESKVEEVVNALSDLLKIKILGDAADKTTDIGPLVAKRQLELLEAQVADAVTKGAMIELGGKQPANNLGAFYEPTLITSPNPEMRIWQEEVFGPVLLIVGFKDEAQAIRMANHTQYGLGAYIFTKDINRFTRVAKQIESGMVAHNNVSYVNPHNPFGGYKMSGGGREHAQFGFGEVTQIKVIASEK